MSNNRILLQRARQASAALVVFSLLLSVVALRATAAPAATTAAPAPVASVSVVPATNEASATVSWTVGSGPTADAFDITVLDAGATVDSLICPSSSCRSKPLRGLTPGHSYAVSVVARNAAGSSSAVTSAAAPIVSGCTGTTTYCISIDATTTNGPATPRAQGLLHSNLPSVDATKLAPLLPGSWRVRAINSFTSYDSASATGAKVTVLIGDAWLGATAATNNGYAAGPWKDWAAYGAWVTGYVHWFLDSGRHPAYWDVMNEPGNPGYLSPADLPDWSVDRQLEQFKVAYLAIKAVDPNANVIGPSPDGYRPYLGAPAVRQLDIPTFIQYVSANGLRPAAISWHENILDTIADFGTQPTNVADHINEARGLLAAAGLAGTKILVNEWGSAPVSEPGWDVGYLAALDQANVDGANRSCYYLNTGMQEIYTCEEPSLDGLVEPLTQMTRAPYWVQLAYASMQGMRVVTRASHATFSALAARTTDGTIHALVGRHQDCTPDVNLNCTSGHLASPPVNLPVTVQVPAGASAYRVQVALIPNTELPVPATIPVSDQNVNVAGGKVQLTLPLVLDGSAYTVTMTPATAGTCLFGVCLRL